MSKGDKGQVILNVTMLRNIYKQSTQITVGDLLLHFLPFNGAIRFVFILNASAFGLAEEGAVDARHNDGGCGVKRADNEHLLFLVVANEASDGAVGFRSGQTIGFADALLVGHRMLHELLGAVREWVRHASLGEERKIRMS